MKTKQLKEEAILRAIKNLNELDNVGAYGYIYIDYLVDTIAVQAFGVERSRRVCGTVYYPTDVNEYRTLMKKIAAVIDGMANKGIINVSKSKKMFKVL